MNSKGHFYISLVKSAIRITSCILAIRFKSVVHLAYGLAIAELLGVLEEVFDER